MTGDARPLILDADGVFLAERPYWNAALGAALQAAGLVEAVAGRWESLADAAFGPVGLQRVTKSAGCNSNWDLAAVLTRALEDTTWRGVVEELLAADGRERDAMQTLRAAAGRLRNEEVAGATAATVDDPLESFGVERGSAFFDEVVERFQKVLHGEAGLDWRFERRQLKESPVATAWALGAARDAGYTLRVCTGRHRAEIEAPIRALGLEPLFPFDEITSADEVDRAELRSGRTALGKPHWFAPACATVGFEAAFEALARGGRLGGSGLYVGDAWADYLAVAAARDRGIELGYVHVQSGVTTKEQERTIAERDWALGVVAELAGVVPLLSRLPS